MIQRDNSISLALGVPGIILQIAGNVIVQANQGASVAMLGVPVSLRGT